MKTLVAFGMIFLSGTAFAENVSAPAPAAAPTQATLDLEWETVEEAIGYELRLTPVGGGKPLVFSTPESRFSHTMPVGTYKLEIRSKEKSSGFYGQWSPPTEVEVAPKIAGLLEPADNAVLNEPEGKRQKITFTWAAAPGAKDYRLRIWDESPQHTEAKAQEFVTPKTSKTLDLPAGRVYHWQVAIEDTKSVQYRAALQTFSFTILGKRLTTPIVDAKIGLPHVSELHWSRAIGADGFHARLLSHALDETVWAVRADLPDVHDRKIKFSTPLKPGVYRVEVTAHAKRRLESEVGFYEFVVKPTAEEVEAALATTVK